jgi:hypothetical protein
LLYEQQLNRKNMKTTVLKARKAKPARMVVKETEYTQTLGLPRTIEEVKADIAIAEEEHLQGLGYTTEEVFAKYSLEEEKPEKLPWAMTLEEKKESIRRSEKDYEAGRLRAHKEVFAKYL